jgi:hypothetical protein
MREKKKKTSIGKKEIKEDRQKECKIKTADKDSV